MATHQRFISITPATLMDTFPFPPRTLSDGSAFAMKILFLIFCKRKNPAPQALIQHSFVLFALMLLCTVFFSFCILMLYHLVKAGPGGTTAPRVSKFLETGKNWPVSWPFTCKPTRPEPASHLSLSGLLSCCPCHPGPGTGQPGQPLSPRAHGNYSNQPILSLLGPPHHSFSQKMQ